MQLLWQTCRTHMSVLRTRFQQYTRLCSCIVFSSLFQSRQKTPLSAGIAQVKCINISTQTKSTKTTAQDEYAVLKQEFLKETLIIPMHYFKILFQVSIRREFTANEENQSTKTATNDHLPQNESL